MTTIFNEKTQILDSDREEIGNSNPFHCSSSVIRDMNNDSSTPLPADTGGSDHIFTGEWTDTFDPHYIAFIVTLKADQQGSLYIERSSNGISVGKSTLVTNILDLAEGQRLGDAPSARYIRLKYVNGPVAQSIFRLSLILSTFVTGFSFQMLKQALVDDTMMLNTNAVLSGEDQSGDFVKIRSTETGNLMISDFLVEVSRGNIPGYSMVHKFGAGQLTDTPTVVSLGGVYQTPVTNIALEFVSDSSNDSASGSGAQEVTIIGLTNIGGSWDEVTQTIETNGTTPVQLSTDLIRINRWYVSRTGTYSSLITGSHAGNLTIRVSGGGATWSLIPISPVAFGQSQIGAYTVPSGKTAYIVSKTLFIDTSKTADIYFFQRQNADDVVTPFSGTKRLIEREIGLQGGYSIDFKIPKGPFVGPCDLGFVGVVSSGTSDISIEFVLLVIDN